jgi:NIMA (never in mitosis gene a)-related kinase
MEDYEVLGLIGKGNFGSISKILRKSDNKILVWKELDYGLMSEKEKQNIVSEVNILKELHHPNIVQYYDRIIDKKNKKIFIIMEYCEGGDIGNVIKKLKKTKEYFPEELIWKFFIQVLMALKTCHNHKEGKILHRDIKPSNVFLDGENNAKLGDFGLSRMLSEENNFAYSRVGTPYYMSPEQIEDMRYNEKSDIWSLGCFLYELATFSPPFNATNQLSLALKIKSGNVANIPSIYSQELSSVIMCLMRVNPENRPNAEEITNYPPVIIRIRERKLKEYYLKLKKKEQDLQKREEIVNMKEEEIKKKEKDFVERESEINKKEDNLENKELELHKREMMVEIREKELLEKEESLKQKNNLYNNSIQNNNHTINQNIQFQNAPIGQVNFDFNKLNINKTGNNY